MTDYLQRLEQEIAAKQAALAELQASLAELETAARVLRRYQEPSASSIQEHSAASNNGAAHEQKDEASSETAPAKVARATQQKTAGQWAFEILSERSPLHYKDIAQEAIRRGFRSRQSSDPNAPIRTIMVYLYRHLDTFEPTGKGFFALKEK
jgi:hypothetical protein